MIEVGKINYLKVNRQTDIGYVLEDEENNNVVLHFNDTNKEEVIVGSYIYVFIYLDSKQRPSATLEEIILSVGQEGFLKVVGITDIGFFVNNGIKKDILINIKYFKNTPKVSHPKLGDMVLSVLKYDGYLFAIPLMEPHQKPKGVLEVGTKVDAYVTKIDTSGIRVVTSDLNIIFIYKDYARGTHRIGELLSVTVTKALDNGTYYGKAIDNKEVMMADDASVIISYLLNHDSTMELTSESSSEEVYDTLKMSRKAFKRALGSLYKRRLIDFKDNKTILLDKNAGVENE